MTCSGICQLPESKLHAGRHAFWTDAPRPRTNEV